MRTAGNVATGGFHNNPAPALPMGRDIDRDAIRARREQKAAALAARNPFARPGVAQTSSEARTLGGLLVDRGYEAAAFTTPQPTPDQKKAAPKPKPRPPASKPDTPRAIDAAAVVRDYVEDGLDVARIARRHDASIAEVHRILEATPGVELGTDTATKPEPAPKPKSGETSRDVRNRQIVALYTGTEQLTMPQIAERLGCAVSTVSRIINLAGVEVVRGRRPAPDAPSRTAQAVIDRARPRPSVRKLRRASGFMWTCPGHQPLASGIARTFDAAMSALDHHIHEKHA